MGQLSDGSHGSWVTKCDRGVYKFHDFRPVILLNVYNYHILAY